MNTWEYQTCVIKKGQKHNVKAGLDIRNILMSETIETDVCPINNQYDPLMNQSEQQMRIYIKTTNEN
jgi:hypothetical protein